MKKAIRLFREINWRRGAGELLGFAIITPFIVMLVCAILSSAQISTANQKMTYSAYSVCRASVVCESPTLVKDRADAVMKSLYGERNFKGGSLALTSTDTAHRSVPTNLRNGQVYYVLELVGQGAAWQKGNMLKCTIYQQINPLMPFANSRHEQTITMMIENDSTGANIDDLADDSN